MVTRHHPCRRKNSTGPALHACLSGRRVFGISRAIPGAFFSVPHTLLLHAWEFTDFPAVLGGQRHLRSGLRPGLLEYQ